MALISRFAFRVPVEDAPQEPAQPDAGGLGFAPLSVLWTYASPKDLAPAGGRGGPGNLSPTEIRIRCLGCNLQWIACQGTPGDKVGSFEQINGHVRLICPGCSNEGSLPMAAFGTRRGGDG